MDRKTANKTTKDIFAALKAAGLEDMFNIEQVGNGRYSDKDFTIKLRFTDKGAKSRSEIALNYGGVIHKVNVAGVGPKGERLVEYSNRAPKYPFVYVTKRGAHYKITADRARQMFGTTA